MGGFSTRGRLLLGLSQPEGDSPAAHPGRARGRLLLHQAHEAAYFDGAADEEAVGGEKQPKEAATLRSHALFSLVASTKVDGANTPRCAALLSQASSAGTSEAGDTPLERTPSRAKSLLAFSSSPRDEVPEDARGERPTRRALLEERAGAEGEGGDDLC